MKRDLEAEGKPQSRGPFPSLPILLVLCNRGQATETFSLPFIRDPSPQVFPSGLPETPPGTRASEVPGETVGQTAGAAVTPSCSFQL